MCFFFFTKPCFTESAHSFLVEKTILPKLWPLSLHFLKRFPKPYTNSLGLLLLHCKHSWKKMYLKICKIFGSLFYFYHLLRKHWSSFKYFKDFDLKFLWIRNKNCWIKFEIWKKGKIYVFLLLCFLHYKHHCIHITMLLSSNLILKHSPHFKHYCSKEHP